MQDHILGGEVVEVDDVASCFADCAARPDSAFGRASRTGCKDYETCGVVGEKVVGGDYDLGGYERMMGKVRSNFDPLNRMVVCIHVGFEGCPPDCWLLRSRET
jgi:hypothetical protein